METCDFPPDPEIREVMLKQEKEMERMLNSSYSAKKSEKHVDMNMQRSASEQKVSKSMRSHIIASNIS